MVRIPKSFLRKLPSFVPSEVCFVQQNSHQLRNRQRWMSIVELDGDFSGKVSPVTIARVKAPDQIGQRTGNKEILLDKTQSLAHRGVIVGIQHSCQRFGL